MWLATKERNSWRSARIDEVGTTGRQWPIVVLDPEDARRETVADTTLFVALPHEFRGTHMSCFVEVLSEHRGDVIMGTLPCYLGDLYGRLDVRSVSNVGRI